MKLYYVPLEEIRKINDWKILADVFRINTMYMVQQANSGHIGSSFSCIDLITQLYYEIMGPDDIFILSKGHAAPALYSVLIGKEIIPFDCIHGLRRLYGLPGHPTIEVPGVFCNTGSLGMGISKARGMAIAKKLMGEKGTIFVLVGDGELEEGQCYEAMYAPHFVEGVVIYVDLNYSSLNNKIDTRGPLWSLPIEVSWRRSQKGKGISFLEKDWLNSNRILNEEEYKGALDEIVKRLEEKGYDIRLEEIDQIPPYRPMKSTLIKDYSEILLEIGDRLNIIVLDADLTKECGLTLFKEKYPDRFIQCGISEQDMVSTAGGLALKGFLPIVHSFAQFLTGRAYEQIYNNATEGTKIIYVGTLAGVLPNGPGISHESDNRDIALMRTIPNLQIFEVSNGGELREAMMYAVYGTEKSIYIRICEYPDLNKLIIL